MTKPIGPICNLACKYCFYLEKKGLFAKNERFRMSDDVLEANVKQYIEGQDVPEINFAWQGGEPTLLGVNFFRKVVALQLTYASGKRISNVIQTNGTLLDDEWCAFFTEHQFLVGISIDGPAHLHDVYRVDKRQRPTLHDVMRGVELLKKHKTEFNTLTVVNRRNSCEPLAVYRFLREIGSGFMQFIPLVEREAGDSAKELGLDLAVPPDPEGDADPGSPVTSWSANPEQYGTFLIEIFEEWVRQDVGKYFVQMFDVALGNWLGTPPSLWADSRWGCGCCQSCASRQRREQPPLFPSGDGIAKSTRAGRRWRRERRLPLRKSPIPARRSQGRRHGFPRATALPPDRRKTNCPPGALGQ